MTEVFNIAEDRLDPAMRAILDASPTLESYEIGAMRRHALASKAAWNERSDDGLALTAATPEMPMRIAKVDARGAPVVHLHGGGWCIGSPETHLSLLAGLATASKRPILAPHPRQAPEHLYPEPLNDVLAALRRLHDPHVILCGDSAGANLALSAVLKARDSGDRLTVAALVLFYGCYRQTFDTESHSRFGSGYGLTTEKMQRFWMNYAPEGGAYADLSHADLSGLPPVQLHLAECDPLADDTRWLHARLGDHAVEVELVEWPGMAHGFLHYARDLPQARDAFAHAARFIGEHS